MGGGVTKVTTVLWSPAEELMQLLGLFESSREFAVPPTAKTLSDYRFGCAPHADGWPGAVLPASPIGAEPASLAVGVT